MGFLAIKTDNYNNFTLAQWAALQQAPAGVSLGQPVRFRDDSGEKWKAFFSDQFVPDDCGVIGAIATDFDNFPDFDPDTVDDIHAADVAFADAIGIEPWDGDADNPWQAALDAQGTFDWLHADASAPDGWTEDD